MSRAQAVVDHVVARRLVDAAAVCFDRDGYHRTSVRQIAMDAGCSVAVLYEHFRSKQALLFEFIDAAYTAAVIQIEAAVALAGDDPAGRLEAAVWAQCDFQMRYQRACRVAQSEWSHLDAGDRERLARKRVRAAQIVSEIMEEGAATGAFDVLDPEATSRALLTMCGAIGTWYDPGGHEVPRRIANTYCELAARMAGVDLSRVEEPQRLAAVPKRRSA
jgi:AcrR family transcriptional regulator